MYVKVGLLVAIPLLAGILMACGQQPAVAATTIPTSHPTITTTTTPTTKPTGVAFGPSLPTRTNPTSTVATTDPTPTTTPTSIPTNTPVPFDPSKVNIRITVPDLGIDQMMAVPVDLGPKGELIVPDSGIGWYIQSALPGQGDNVAFWAHVYGLAGSGRNGPFYKLGELLPGAIATIITPEKTYQYQLREAPYVVSTKEVDFIKTDIWGPSVPKVLGERITFISCDPRVPIRKDGRIIDSEARIIAVFYPISE
jgi:sortase (surface protein transpeptidase)